MRQARKGPDWRPVDSGRPKLASPLGCEAVLVLRHETGATAWFYEAAALGEVMSAEPPLVPEAKLLLIEPVAGPKALAALLEALAQVPGLPKPLYLALDEAAAAAPEIAAELPGAAAGRLAWRGDVRRPEAYLGPLTAAPGAEDLAAAKRSLSRHPRRFEGERAGHLKGRAHWFTRRQGRSGS